MLFSIRGKRIIWAYNVVKKRRRVLALFISIFLRNQSLSDTNWFYGKKHKIGKKNLYLTENQLSWNEMCCASDNHNYIMYMCHTCAKEFSNSSFNEAGIDKISNFHDIPPNFTFSQKSYFFKYICNFLARLLHPYKFYGRDMSGILFFIFASCEPLRVSKLCSLIQITYKKICFKPVMYENKPFSTKIKLFYIKLAYCHVTPSIYRNWC